MNRVKKIMDEYKKNIGELGDPRHSMTERRKILKKLRDMEQKLDKHYKIEVK